MKKTSKKKKWLILLSFCLIGILLVPDIYFIANKMGITIAPQWYQDIVDWVSAGGTLSGAFLAVLGVTVPAWLAAAASAFSIASA